MFLQSLSCSQYLGVSFVRYHNMQSFFAILTHVHTRNNLQITLIYHILLLIYTWHSIIPTGVVVFATPSLLLASDLSCILQYLLPLMAVLHFLPADIENPLYLQIQIHPEKIEGVPLHEQ